MPGRCGPAHSIEEARRSEQSRRRVVSGQRSAGLDAGHRRKLPSPKDLDSRVNLSLMARLGALPLAALALAGFVSAQALQKPQFFPPRIKAGELPPLPVAQRRRRRRSSHRSAGRSARRGDTSQYPEGNATLHTVRARGDRAVAVRAGARHRLQGPRDDRRNARHRRCDLSTAGLAEHADNRRAAEGPDETVW